MRRVPDHAGAHRLRISSLLALMRHNEVLGSCDAYLARKEPTAEVLEIRGLARVAREELPGAIADYTRAIELRPDDVDDIVQEVLLKLLAAMKSFDYDPDRSFRAWLKTVTQNAWSDFVRSHRRELTKDPEWFRALLDSSAALDDLSGRMEDAFDRELLDVAMRRAEKRVKPANWQAFRLTAIDQRTGADVAQELGMTVARVFIAKHRIKWMIEEEMRRLSYQPN
jgi:RNA polymerase sigma factor (sigma-70 family)